MNYQPRNKPALSRYSTAIKVVLSVAAIVIVLSFVAPRALSGFFSKLFSPLWRIPTSIYSAQNAGLQQQVEAQSSTAAALADLEQENAELKMMLGRPLTKNTVLAVVLKKPPFAAYDNVIIDIGADHGVAVGNMVYAVSSNSASLTISTTSVQASTSGALSTSSVPVASPVPIVPTAVKVPIGLISEVDGVTSKVALFSSPGQKYTVEIGKNHLVVTATGQGAGTFNTVLPHEANIAVGDVVIIPSIEPVVFATVSAIVSDPARPYATVLFQSPVNPFTLHWVEVATGTVPVK